MNKAEKLKAKLLAGQGYHNFSFDDLVLLLENLGFIRRPQSGTSHERFMHPAFVDVVNIQPKKGQCKPYQLRQIRNLIKEHNL